MNQSRGAASKSNRITEAKDLKVQVKGEGRRSSREILHPDELVAAAKSAGLSPRNMTGGELRLDQFQARDLCALSNP